jgi:hypothetical protein
MKHLKVAGCARLVVPAAEREASDLCLVDYSHCPNADLCWIADFDGGCNSVDNCIFDTM